MAKKAAQEREFDQDAWLCALWLSGETFTEVAASEFYTGSSLYARSEIINRWNELDNAFRIVTSAMRIDGMERARIVRTLKKPPNCK